MKRRGDGILVALAALHAGVLLAWPTAPAIAAGIWWNSNTISHNFIHRPFFRARAMNRVFSLALSVLLGIPQTLWRERHLAHHAGVEWRWRARPWLIVEILLVTGVWAILLHLAPGFFMRAWVRGYLAGLALCAAQGYWEHAGGEPISHYGRLYNFMCFNDGYHAEHHAMPGVHWSELPARQRAGAATSKYPALLRWIEGLERMVLRSPALQRFVVSRHRRAMEKLLPQIGEVRRITIVGGGLFPRTALILSNILPEARLTIVDSDRRNIETARGRIEANIEWRTDRYRPGERIAADLVVIPLCFCGRREAVYANPPAAAVLVHDWIWRRRGTGAIVSWLLMKRINLVRS